MKETITDKKKNSFVFYETFYDMLKELPDDMRLRFYDYIALYGLYEEEPELTGIEKALWSQIKYNLNESKKRYVSSVENGKKGGRPNKTQDISEETQENLDITQNNPSKTQKNLTERVQNLNDNDNDNVNDNENLNLADKPPVRQPLTQRQPKNDIEQVEKAYLLNYDSLYKQKVLKMDKPIINWGQSRKLTRSVIDSYGLQNILLAIERSKSNDFCIQKGYSLTTILSSGVLAGLINGGGKSKNPLDDFEHPDDIMDDVIF